MTRPVAYGYMRVTRDMEDEEAWLIENRIREYAQDQGLELRETHYEYDDRLTNVAALLSFTWYHKAEHIIVPSLAQITNHYANQAAVALAITIDARATLHNVSGEPRGL